MSDLGDIIALVLAASEMGDIDLGLLEHRRPTPESPGHGATELFDPLFDPLDAFRGAAPGA